MGLTIGRTVQPPRCEPIITAQNVQEYFGTTDPPRADAIFVDASFHSIAQSWGDVLEPAANLPHGGQISCAAVLMSTKGDWREKPISILRYAEDTYRPNTSSYAGELVGGLVALTIARQYPRPLPIWTDCLSARYTTLGALHHTGRPPGTRAHPHLVHRVQSFPPRGAIHHIHSHPERRMPNRDEWTTQDWGIWIADEAAAGEWQSIHEVFPQVCATRNFPSVKHTMFPHLAIVGCGTPVMMNSSFFGTYENDGNAPAFRSISPSGTSPGRNAEDPPYGQP